MKKLFLPLLILGIVINQVWMMIAITGLSIQSPSSTTTVNTGTSSTISITCLRTKNNSDSGYGYTSFQNGTPSSTVASKCGY